MAERKRGMNIDQLISMLMAGKQQGATHAYISRALGDGGGECSGIDWVSMAPVDGVLYIGALDPANRWEDMSNEAMESLDW